MAGLIGARAAGKAALVGFGALALFHLAMIGGVSCLTLLGGSEEDVYDEAVACMEAGKPGGRYILGSACAVPRFAPQPNLVAAARAARERGQYRGRDV